MKKRQKFGRCRMRGSMGAEITSPQTLPKYLLPSNLQCRVPISCSYSPQGDILHASLILSLSLFLSLSLTHHSPLSSTFIHPLTISSIASSVSENTSTIINSSLQSVIAAFIFASAFFTLTRRDGSAQVQGFPRAPSRFFSHHLDFFDSALDLAEADVCHTCLSCLAVVAKDTDLAIKASMALFKETYRRNKKNGTLGGIGPM